MLRATREYLTSGHLNQVMTIRGKLRHGFDFNLHCSWVAKLEATAELSEREVKGTVVIQDASRDAVQARPAVPCMVRLRRGGTNACACLLHHAV